jgi:hypothetical protein
MNAPMDWSAFSADSAGRLRVHGQIKSCEPTFYSGRVCEFSKGTPSRWKRAQLKAGAQVLFFNNELTRTAYNLD